MSKTIVCIQCPQSCRLTVNMEEGRVVVAGNKCPRGIDYGQTELINPRRTLTSTVKTIFSDIPLLPVRTREEIPLAAIFTAMKEINGIVVHERLAPGDVVLSNLAGTEVALIATDSMTVRGDLLDQQSAACH